MKAGRVHTTKRSAWFQPSKLLKCNILGSKFAFKWVNLCRYAKAVYLGLSRGLRALPG